MYIRNKIKHFFPVILFITPLALAVITTTERTSHGYSNDEFQQKNPNTKTSVYDNTTLTHYHGTCYRSDFISINNSKTFKYELIRRSNLNERNYIWFAVKLIVKVSLAGYSLYATVRDCKDWSKGGTSGKVDCVVGAVSTVVSFAGIGNQVSEYINLGNHMATSTNGVPSKRDKLYEGDLGLKTASILAGNTPFSVAVLYREDGTWARNDQTGWPIYLLQNDKGSIYHFSTMKANETHHIFRIATAHANIDSPKRDEQFNLENFSEGGIESGMQKVENTNAAVINTGGDYGTIDHQVSCQIDMNAHAYEYIMWDYNHNTAMGTGWFYAYQYTTYDDVHAEVIPYPGTSAPDMGNCYVS